jgi:hypothetical protein
MAIIVSWGCSSVEECFKALGLSPAMKKQNKTNSYNKKQNNNLWWTKFEQGHSE